MRILTTSDLYYVSGGDEGGGSGEGGGEGGSEGGSERETCAANADKQACLDFCSRYLPSGNNGFGFWNCMNNCYSPFRTGSSTNYGYFENFA